MDGTGPNGLCQTLTFGLVFLLVCVTFVLKRRRRAQGDEGPKGKEVEGWPTTVQGDDPTGMASCERLAEERVRKLVECVQKRCERRAPDPVAKAIEGMPTRVRTEVACWVRNREMLLWVVREQLVLGFKQSIKDVYRSVTKECASQGETKAETELRVAEAIEATIKEQQTVLLGCLKERMPEAETLFDVLLAECKASLDQVVADTVDDLVGENDLLLHYIAANFVDTTVKVVRGKVAGSLSKEEVEECFKATGLRVSEGKVREVMEDLVLSVADCVWLQKMNVQDADGLAPLIHKAVDQLRNYSPPQVL